ncbi:unnamed protein product [Haemonchus placei]|uniref:DUF5641 domain-containing protein n=1 Tax=Haemonchus placei TaxID=6290 RepID=A0A0N4W9Y4_HAEPC|nr:unnamed protein product [Haemonchus placei]
MAVNHQGMDKKGLDPIQREECAGDRVMALMACETAVSLAQFLLKELTINIKTTRIWYSIGSINIKIVLRRRSSTIESSGFVVLYWLHKHKDRPAKAFVDNRVKRIRCAINDFTSKDIFIMYHRSPIQQNVQPEDSLYERFLATSGTHLCRSCPMTWPHPTMNFNIFPGSTAETEAELKFLHFLQSTIIVQCYHFEGLIILMSYYIVKILKKRIYDRVSLQNQARLNSALFLVGVTSVPKIETQDRESATQLRLNPIKTKKTYKDLIGITRVVKAWRLRQRIPSYLRPIMRSRTLTEKIVGQSHLALSHAGVEHHVSVSRRRHFIPRIRTPVRSIVRQCVPCQRQQACLYNYSNPPNLPFERVTRKQWIIFVVVEEGLPPGVVRTHPKLSKRHARIAFMAYSFGGAVLIAQDNVSRTPWPLVIITRLNKSQDGVLRSWQVKTGKNTYTDRSINRPIPLELHVPTAEDPTDNIHHRKPRTRSVSPMLPTRTQPVSSQKEALEASSIQFLFG